MMQEVSPQQELLELQAKLVGLRGDVDEALTGVRNALEKLGLSPNPPDQTTSPNVQLEGLHPDDSLIMTYFYNTLYKAQRKGRQLNMPQFSRETFKEMERILHSGLLRHFIFSRPHFAILGILIEERDKIQHLPGLTKRLNCAPSIAYSSLCSLRREIGFTTKSVNYAPQDQTFRLIDSPQEEFTLDPKYQESFNQLVSDITDKCGYSPELKTNEISSLIRRGLAFFLEKRFLGETSIPYNVLLEKTGPTQYNVRAKVIAHHFHMALPKEWKTVADNRRREFTFA